MAESIPLATLYAKALDGISKIVNLPLEPQQKKELVAQSLSNLKTVHARIVDLCLFSPNETLEDISTRDLVYLSLPFVLAEAQSRVQAASRSGRLALLDQTQRYLKSFVSILETYVIVPEAERELYEKPAFVIRDPAKRRELKITQFKKERDLKSRMQMLWKRRPQQPAPEHVPSPFELVASLLPTPSEAKEGKEIDAQTDEIIRETTLILLRLMHVQAQSQLESLTQEEHLLNQAPPSPTTNTPQMSEDKRLKDREEGTSMWRLDARPSGGPDGKGPLLDSSGKILRWFTLLPSDAGERMRLQSQVFGPSHNLPTMSIDEYLEIERENGNIITGGGAASQNIATSSEQLQIASEMDGTAEGQWKSEIKRQKDERWAQFTDANARGAGNTMNRG